MSSLDAVDHKKDLFFYDTDSGQYDMGRRYCSVCNDFVVGGFEIMARKRVSLNVILVEFFHDQFSIKVCCSRKECLETAKTLVNASYGSSIESIGRQKTNCRSCQKICEPIDICKKCYWAAYCSETCKIKDHGNHSQVCVTMAVEMKVFQIQVCCYHIVPGKEKRQLMLKPGSKIAMLDKSNVECTFCRKASVVNFFCVPVGKDRSDILNLYHCDSEFCIASTRILKAHLKLDPKRLS